MNKFSIAKSLGFTSLNVLKQMKGQRMIMANQFSTETAAEGAKKTHGDDVVVVSETFMTLEWCLHSPPPLHQFDESPLVVETHGPADPYHD